MTSTTDRTLTLAGGVGEALLEHAREGARDPPREVCGVLVGDRARLRVTEAVRVRNVAATPRTRYEFDPAETVRAVDDAESRGLDAVGFYHSHPESPARLSDVDRAEAAWVDHVYAVVSPAADAGVGERTASEAADEAVGGDGTAGTVAAWRYTGDGFDLLRVRDEA